MTTQPTDPLEAATLRERPSTAAARPGGLAVGALVAGRYRILELVGEGGMGVVYRARDLVLDADIALKRLHADVARDADRLAVFRNEVRTARKVTHPNVCRLHDLDEADPGGCFLTMEYVAGEALSARLRRGGLDPAAALHVLRGIAAGLAAAHDAGVVHRDLKPANVLLAAATPRAGVAAVVGDRVVVCDFGIAGDRTALASGPQHVAGTDGYMAPEQARGAAVDARADVYAFGVVAAVAAVGVPAGDDDGSVLTALVAACRANALPGTAAVARISPPELAALVARCLAVDPAERPADAGELVRALDAVAGELPAPPGKTRGRARMGFALGACATVVATTVLIATGALRGDGAAGPAAAAPAVAPPVWTAARDAGAGELAPADAATERWLGDATY